jgi:2-iminobutanoate/2-iminopropanoate deaminase
MDSLPVTAVTTSRAPKGRGPFPQAVRYGGLLYVSGQGPLDPATSEPNTGSFEHEARLTLSNLAAIAEAGGCTLGDALKLTVYLADIANVPAFNVIYREYFGNHVPARTLVQVGLRGIQVEIDGVFACPAPDGEGGAGATLH